jgi:hypothetical protein
MSAGRSESRKKRALLVPPRMIVHGMEDSFTAGMRIGLLDRLTLNVNYILRGEGLLANGEKNPGV